MSDATFDLSMQAVNHIAFRENNWDRLVNTIDKLLVALTQEGYFSLEVREHEDQEGADYYLRAVVKKQYLGKSIEEQWNVFSADLHYWSDRWCYARAYTCQYIWSLLKDNKSVVEKE